MFDGEVIGLQLCLTSPQRNIPPALQFVRACAHGRLRTDVCHHRTFVAGTSLQAPPHRTICRTQISLPECREQVSRGAAKGGAVSRGFCHDEGGEAMK